MSVLFSPLSLRAVTCRNRVFVSPMCQYSCEDGLVTDWHLVHLGARAVGGAGMVITEATAVSPEGRITPFDAGIWSDAHAQAWSQIARFLAEQGAVPALQLAHAGRKASMDRPWRGGALVERERGGWEPVAPSPVAYDGSYATPRELAAGDLDRIEAAFAQGARRALVAGFRALEIHMAHGYLLHEFLSPLVNRRTDAHGGSLDNRMRFPLRVARAVREAWPAELPLLVRISATDWAEGGWDLAQSVEFCRRLRALGVDLVDCSSGGAVPHQQVPVGPGYQVPFAAAIRREAEIATGAVGLITAPAQAEAIVAAGDADAVLLAREFLREPYWPLKAARALGADIDWPPQYLRGRP